MGITPVLIHESGIYRWEKIREEVKVGPHVEVCGDEELVEHRGGESGSGQKTKAWCG